MAYSPERDIVRQSEQTPPKGVEVHPEDISIPEALEKGGVKPIPSQPKPVQDDSGQVLAQPQPAQSQVPTVSIPYDEETLHKWSKGSTSDARTWLAVFWERFILKAVRGGWRMVFGKGGTDAT